MSSTNDSIGSDADVPEPAEPAGRFGRLSESFRRLSESTCDSFGRVVVFDKSLLRSVESV
ncbi:hypothetical protein RSSM_05953 [Rhodopirellula sallentina SM41]|uniref:Uncharacterized protein n=1 Tax=Rhodopirellula sallentina SM41 TaxID=1263870 RepID=M5U9D9_9BACT|nr:hypothetical protein RSSM_05953 [Rhodopirellula sallentina SM41]